MDGPQIRVLAAAFAAVPGSSAHTPSMLSMVDGLRAELDLVTVKTQDLSHVKRIGDSRMFRVPVGAGTIAEQRDVYRRAVARQIDAEPYQIVHALDPYAGEAAAARRGVRGFALVYEVTSYPDPDEGDEQAFWLAHERTLAAADRIVVPTGAASLALEARGHAGRVEVIPPGVDVGAFDWQESVALGVPRLLYLGPFSAARDLTTLIDALAKVSSLRPVRALLAGERRADRRAALRQTVEAAGLSEIVDVRGEPNPRSLPDILGAADVCLLPARADRSAGLFLPLPLLEPMACHRPVVVADSPAVREIVRDEREGLLYPAGDASAMADAILEVLRDAVLRERIADAAYRRVRDELSSGARRRRIRQVYEALAPGSQTHDPWRKDFEELTGMIELSTSALEALQGAEPETLPPAAPSRDTGSSETTRPHIAPRSTYADVPTPPSTDTQPGLVLPDTDPGRR